jgi:DNA polymerase/3'-5' exonuclease PolX
MAMSLPVTPTDRHPALSNAEIADRLMGLAQLLSAQKENPYKIKAYRRAAKSIGACRKVSRNSCAKMPT